MSDESEESGNLYASIPGNLDNELFELIIKNKNIKIERIISKGHKSPETGWYDQVHNEWVVLIKGAAIIIFEDKELAMGPGAYVNIPAHTRHKVTSTNPEEETIWLAIHY